VVISIIVLVMIVLITFVVVGGRIVMPCINVLVGAAGGLSA
jgi:hypothetical protein